MKFAAIGCGVLLVIVGIIAMIGVGGYNRLVSMTPEQNKFIRSKLDALRKIIRDTERNLTIPSILGSLPWKTVEMSIDGAPCKLQIRDYPSAVPLKQIVDSMEYSSTGLKSAMGCYAQTMAASRSVRSHRDLKKLGELFEDPDQIMRFYTEQAKLRGGFKQYASMIRKRSDEAYNGKCLLGEIVISDQHVFVNKMPTIGQPTFTVFRKGKDGLYRNVNEWDATMKPFLKNRRVLDLFGRIKKDRPQ